VGRMARKVSMSIVRRRKMGRAVVGAGAEKGTAQTSIEHSTGNDPRAEAARGHHMNRRNKD
jgi:hypothetical protein